MKRGKKKCVKKMKKAKVLPIHKDYKINVLLKNMTNYKYMYDFIV